MRAARNGSFITGIAIAFFMVATTAFAQQETFVMPSGNVECTYTGPAGTSVYQPQGGMAELSCDRAEPTYVRVLMPARGAVKLIRNVGDPSCCGVEPKLTYGTVWRKAPFTCESNEAGIICRRDDGTGFQMSRRGVSLQ